MTRHENNLDGMGETGITIKKGNRVKWQCLVTELQYRPVDTKGPEIG